MTEILNPAERASQRALSEIKQCIENNQCFLLEAGAGAGKTYSLNQTLDYLIDTRAKELVRNHQRIACITYTNIAADQITLVTDGHPAVFASTIHVFIWHMIQGYQPFLRAHLLEIPQWKNIIDDTEQISSQLVKYELGHRKISDKEILLHHDDIVLLSARLLAQEKFRIQLLSKFPIIFIDEYQDTNKEFATALIENCIDNQSGHLIGFFGDHWQKIYRTGCGQIENSKIELINKESNFRSAPTIVNALNQMRPALPQNVSNPEAQGSIQIFHSNTWAGERKTNNPWQGDLPVNEAHQYLEQLKVKLEDQGWDFTPSTSPSQKPDTKVLMLTHNVIASELGYPTIFSTFRYNDAFVKKENRHIAYFIDVIEPVCRAYEEGKFGEMFRVLGRNFPPLRSQEEKGVWVEEMDRILELRSNGTIKDIVDYLEFANCLNLPDSILNKESDLREWLQQETKEENRSLSELNELHKAPYKEIMALEEYLNERTPFSTKHGVKGDEFKNVLVVLGRGWNLYNWNNYLEWSSTGIPNGSESAFHRNRNLFYVACSRPKTNLCLLFTQSLSDTALETLSKWFGSEIIKPLDLN